VSSALNPDLNFPGLREGDRVASAAEAVNVGRELKRDLERVARQEGYDATGLARRLLRDYVGAHGGRV
jgi:hypothetical protein